MRLFERLIRREPFFRYIYPSITNGTDLLIIAAANMTPFVSVWQHPGPNQKFIIDPKTKQAIVMPEGTYSVEIFGERKSKKQFERALKHLFDVYLHGGGKNKISVSENELDLMRAVARKSATNREAIKRRQTNL